MLYNTIVNNFWRASELNTFYDNNIEVNINRIWQDALEEISKNVSIVSFDVWIKTLEVTDLKGNTLVLATNSTTGKKTLTKDYKDIIVSCLNKVHSAIIDVEFVVSNQTMEEPADEEVEPIAEKKAVAQPKVAARTFAFNPKYTFDTFVVGPSNQFVTAAAKSVAENPGASFNPLFVYGGVGLGKTHLLHAIGNYICETKPHLNVVYVTIEKFMNELIESIQNNRRGASGSNSDFRAKYRTADVLIVDDIQFIIGKNAVQEEFFHTFNELHEHGKQIIISSDRPISEINPLEDRLRSRLGWGLPADIGYPELETRIAILNKKAYLERYNVSREVINYIAEAITTNVRTMEGYLTRTVYYAKMLGQSVVTMETAREALKDIAVQNEDTIDAGRIIEVVCKFYNLKKEEILARKRTKEIAQARQVAMFLITELLSMPLEAIGNIFGKDHATVIYAKSKISDEMTKNKKLAVEINDMKQMLKGK